METQLFLFLAVFSEHTAGNFSFAPSVPAQNSGFTSGNISEERMAQGEIRNDKFRLVRLPPGDYLSTFKSTAEVGMQFPISSVIDFLLSKFIHLHSPPPLTKSHKELYLSIYRVENKGYRRNWGSKN